MKPFLMGRLSREPWALKVDLHHHSLDLQCTLPCTLHCAHTLGIVHTPLLTVETSLDLHCDADSVVVEQLWSSLISEFHRCSHPTNHSFVMLATAPCNCAMSDEQSGCMAVCICMAGNGSQSRRGPVPSCCDLLASFHGRPRIHR